MSASSSTPIKRNSTRIQQRNQINNIKKLPEQQLEHKEKQLKISEQQLKLPDEHLKIPEPQLNISDQQKILEHQHARKFIQWYKHMIDNERQNIGLFLSEDSMLEWFGRTIKSKKKVALFLKHDMQCTSHDFTTIQTIEKVQTRDEVLKMKDDTVLASPITSPEVVKPERCGKRKLRLGSPEWAEGCKPNNENLRTEEKKIKLDIKLENQCDTLNLCNLKTEYSDEEESGINHKGDGLLDRRIKRKCVQVTPPNCEVGQGDCMPSTSNSDFNRSHDALNAQLPKLAVECNGFIEFTRTKNRNDTMKWERKCKVQIGYSIDPLNVGEYIIWCLRYTDESRCRRNLLPAFEEAAKEDGLLKKT